MLRYCYHSEMFVHALQASLVSPTSRSIQVVLVAGDQPTGFHLTTPLKSDVSCSSVQASEIEFVSTISFFIGVGTSSVGCSTASPEGVEAALDGKRVFFLGAMMNANVKY